MTQLDCDSKQKGQARIKTIPKRSPIVPYFLITKKYSVHSFCQSNHVIKIEEKSTFSYSQKAQHSAWYMINAQIIEVIYYHLHLPFPQLNPKHHIRLYNHSLGHQAMTTGHSPAKEVLVLAASKIRSATLFYINTTTPENWQLPFLSILILHLFLKVDLRTVLPGENTI